MLPFYLVSISISRFGRKQGIATPLIDNESMLPIISSPVCDPTKHPFLDQHLVGKEFLKVALALLSSEHTRESEKNP
jgi:hypothetical protein